jgi:DNA-directed RNA polymerase specialized sigma24 family protein
MLKLLRQERSSSQTVHEEEFLDRYALVYTWALHLTQDRQQAEELTQDSVLCTSPIRTFKGN